MNPLPLRLAVVGAQKAGTTSLLGYLRQHPALHTHVQREFLYFLADHEYEAGPAAARKKYFPEAPADAALLCKHAMLMYSPEGLQRLADDHPEAHVAVMLRDPVRRAISAFHYARLRGEEPLPNLAEALAAEAPRLEKDGWKKWRNCAYRHNGLYHEQLLRLYELFGQDRVSVVLLDEFKEDAAAVCCALFERAGVDASFAPDTARVHNQAAAPRSTTVARWLKSLLQSRNPLRQGLRRLLPDALAAKARRRLLRLNEKKGVQQPPDPDIVAQLSDYFQPHNEALAALLERDLSAWTSRSSDQPPDATIGQAPLR